MDDRTMPEEEVAGVTLRVVRNPYNSERGIAIRATGYGDAPLEMREGEAVALALWILRATKWSPYPPTEG